MRPGALVPCQPAGVPSCFASRRAPKLADRDPMQPAGSKRMPRLNTVRPHVGMALDQMQPKPSLKEFSATRAGSKRETPTRGVHRSETVIFGRPRQMNQAQALALLAGAIVGIGLIDAWTGIHYSFAIFYLVPVVLCVAWVGRAQGYGLAILSVIVRLVGDSATIDFEPLPLSTWWNSFSAAVVFCVVVRLFGDLLASFREVERRVADRTAELTDSVVKQRELEHELLIVGSSERRAFGQELHDDICQHLVGTAMAAKVLAQRLEGNDLELSRDALAIVAWIEEGAAKSRALAQGLLLSSIEPHLLREKLEELAEDGSRAGVPCVFRCHGDIALHDSGAAAQMYRIAQEAIRNAMRHANPRRIEISIEGAAEVILLTVADDGCGLSLAEPPGQQSMGLRIMAMRAASIGATLSFGTSPSGGTTIVCYVPRCTPG